MRVRSLLGAGLLLGGIVGGLTAGPALTASATPTYPPSAPGITLTADVVAPGQSVGVTGTGFMPVSDVTVTWTGPGAGGLVARVPFGSRALVASAGGVARTSVTFQTIGAHTISLLGTAADGSPLTLSASLVVQAAGGAGLAHTGTSVTTYVGVGLALLLLGALVVTLVRRRRTAAATPAEPAEPPVPVGTP